MENKFHDFHRGEIYFASLDPVYGHEQGGVRPVLVLQNDVGNYYSPTLIVTAATRRTFKKPTQPTHVVLEDAEGLDPSCSCWRSSAPSTSGGCAAMWAGSLRSRWSALTPPCGSASGLTRTLSSPWKWRRRDGQAHHRPGVPGQDTAADGGGVYPAGGKHPFGWGGLFTPHCLGQHHSGRSQPL